MSQYDKMEKRKLRKLADLAYERELESELVSLEKEFKEWKKNNIDSFELSHRIHIFHNGPSQKLYKKYNGLDPDIVVAWAVAKGILKKDEVNEDLINKLEIIIERYK